MGDNNHLAGKRILFFPTFTLGYEKHIKAGMERMGAIVDLYDERPDESFLSKAMIRINRDLIAKKINSYHRRILDETRSIRYDYIFFIRCEAFSVDVLKQFREHHPEAKMIVYFWDSFKNNKNSIRVKDVFDKTFSFDRFDCEQYKMTFLPLFYIDQYSNVMKPKSFKYKNLFIGTLHSDRYKVVRDINSFLTRDQCYFSYFYSPSELLYWKLRLTNKEIRSVKRSEVKFKQIEIDYILDLYGQSEIIIDIQHPNQTGLTMRTFECMGAKRKMITTNKDIVNYDFYNTNNILIIDRDNVQIPQKFLNNEYEDIQEELYHKYSLTSWLCAVFS